jgi:hypothetical protein
MRPGAAILTDHEEFGDMTQTEMEQVLESLDRRRSRVEQILPTLATKDDLKAFATKDDLTQKIEELRRHTQVLFESVRADVRLVAEGLAHLVSRLEDKGVI